MILIVHFGAQYAQLIRRAVNEIGVRAEVVSPAAVSSAPPDGVAGVILSGGPASVNADILATVQKVLAWDCPVLGICLGHQALVAACGGKVAPQFSREYGRATLLLTGEARISRGLPSASSVWMSHGDTVVDLPPRGLGLWTVWGTTRHGPHAGIANELEGLYGVQFHPEVMHTERGMQILENFVLGICGALRNWVPPDRTTELSAAVRDHVGDQGHIFVATSLGVDSTTTALLCGAALGPERVHCVFVDNGLQREEDLLLAQRAHTFLPNFQVIDASEQFLSALEGQGDSEEKRRLVGRTFWEVFRAHALDLQAQFPIIAYAQGTLAPDVIESGKESGSADVIKTHHNVVPPPRDFPFPPFEPLRTLYKDEARLVGRTVGVPEEILNRHPFPGPGFAVRIAGPVTRDRVRIARACDTTFIQALKDHGYYSQISQALVVVLQDRPRGVRGDAGASGCAVLLRAVTTRDFMTADVADLPSRFLADVGDELVNTVPGVADASYRITRKPPATIEWE